LFIDADGNVARDLAAYGPLLNAGAMLILDDYVAPGAPEKACLVKPWVDRQVEEGRLAQLGVYGWGTWVGAVIGRWETESVVPLPDNRRGTDRKGGRVAR
jgi:hypothetical protein